MITWTLTSGNRTVSGAGTNRHEALGEALDAILNLYDLHTAGEASDALPVCTVHLDDHDPIIIRDIADANVERGRRGLAAHLTQTLTDLTGDPFAMLPSAAISETA
jgi:hypothetical protein